jgi:hypothetical protein
VLLKDQCFAWIPKKNQKSVNIIDIIETYVCFAILGCSWPLLGASWGLLGTSWRPLGASWAPLGGLLGPLGRLLEPLGALLEPLRTTCKNHVKIDAKNDRFGPPNGRQKGSQSGPKSDQKSIKNQCKKRSEKNTSARSSWHRLWTILGCFVTALGVIFIDFILVFKAFRENSLFSKIIVSRAILSPTWPILGRFWAPKMPHVGTPKRLQSDQKTT